MQLDSGYRCETCDAKAHLTLWHAIAPDGKTETAKILCIADAAVLSLLGWNINSIGNGN